MSKLTKAQREFFYDFAKNDLSNYLFPLLHAQGITMTPELGEELLTRLNLDEYTQIIGKGFLERVDFTTLKRVDRLMKSDEFLKVVTASHQVSDEVQDERVRILSVLLPDEEEEKAE